MPIQRAPIGSPSYTPVRTPVPDLSPAINQGQVIKQVGETFTQIGNTVMAVAGKRKALQEQIMLKDREQQMIRDMDTARAEIDKDETLQLQARSEFEKRLAKIEAAAYKDLTKEQAMKLKLAVFGDRLRYEHYASQTEDHATVAKVKAQHVLGQEQAVARAADVKNVSDEGAFEKLDKNSADLRAAAEAGLIPRDQVEESIKRAQHSAAYGRGAAMVQANPQRYKDTYDKEAEKPGTTWLARLDPTHRVSLLQTANGELHRRQNEAEKEARLQLKLEQERVENDLYAKHVAGQLTIPEIMAQGALPRSTKEHFVEMVQKGPVEGPGDKNLLLELETAVHYNTRPPAGIRERILDGMRQYRQSGGERGIPLSRGVALLDKVSSTERSLIADDRIARSEARTERRESQSQAWHALNDALTPTGLMGKLDTGQSAALKIAAREELDAMVAAGADPYTAAQTIKTKYQARLTDVALQQIDTYLSMNTYKDKASLRAAIAAGRISESDARQEAWRLMQVEKLQQEMGKLPQPVAPATTGQKKGWGAWFGGGKSESK
jgi:hypothetical protein